MRLKRVFQVGSWAVVAVLWAACGGTVVQSGTGSGGAGGCPAFPPCCEGAVPDTCCALCDTGPSSTSSSSTTASSSTSGGGPSCGGFPGTTCASDQFCSYPDKQCGGNDAPGFCQTEPGSCPNIVDPVCGCDAKVHGNECLANAAGVDIDELGGCTPPAGTFACGARFCRTGLEFCQLDVTLATGADTFSCQPIPAGCASNASCGCLPHVSCPGSCGWTCMPTAGGAFEVTCCH